jgi:hypothetical protein
MTLPQLYLRGHENHKLKGKYRACSFTFYLHFTPEIIKTIFSTIRKSTFQYTRTHSFEHWSSSGAFSAKFLMPHGNTKGGFVNGTPTQMSTDDKFIISPCGSGSALTAKHKLRNGMFFADGKS